jgi:SAM-dependent methyltransferase
MNTDPEEDPSCPLCGGSTHARFRSPAIWYEREARRSFGTYSCDSCDFALFWPRPTPEESQRLYGEHYYTHQVDEAKTTPGPPPPGDGAWDRLRERIAWRFDLGRPLDASAIARLLGPPPARFLDVGCGNGRLLTALRALGYQVVGVEPDEQARAAAESQGLDVLAGQGERLPEALKGPVFDGVSFFHVLEHCNDPLLALREGAALVRAGGHVIAEVPNHAALTARRLGPAWWHSDPGRHVNFFTPRSLRFLFLKAGLTPMRAGHHGFYSQFTTSRAGDERWLVGAYRQLAGEAAVAPYKTPTAAGLWGQMARAALAPPEQKYEATYLIARVPRHRGSGNGPMTNDRRHP